MNIVGVTEEGDWPGAEAEDVTHGVSFLGISLLTFSYAFSILSDSKSFILSESILLVSKASLCFTSSSFILSFPASLSILRLSALKDSWVTATFDFFCLTGGLVWAEETSGGRVGGTNKLGMARETGGRVVGTKILEGDVDGGSDELGEVDKSGDVTIDTVDKVDTEDARVKTGADGFNEEEVCGCAEEYSSTELRSGYNDGRVADATSTGGIEIIEGKEGDVFSVEEKDATLDSSVILWSSRSVASESCP